MKKGSKFLKGVTLSIFWGKIKHFMVKAENHENEHGWWNTVVFRKGRKKLVTTKICMIVDNNEKIVNSSQEQYDRKVVKVTRAKEIREKTLKGISE